MENREKNLGFHKDLEIESNENEEELFDQIVEQALRTEALFKINEGQNGVIAELDLSRLSEDARRYFLGEIGDIEEESLAVKMIKISTNPEVSRHEYQMQKEANRILAESDDQTVGVPKPHAFKEIKITHPEIAEHLKEMGINIGDHKTVDLFVMDLVQGNDLAFLMYREFIRCHREEFEEAYPDMDIETVISTNNIANLMGLVHSLAGIKIQHSNADMSPEAIKERNQVANMIRDRISYRGILNKEQLASLSQAIKTLHQHGIYHRDLHARNIMIADDQSVKIIDFGNAVAVNPSNKEISKGIYTADPEKSFVNDLDVVDFIRPLAKTDHDKEVETSISYLDSAIRLREKLQGKSSKDWRAFKLKIKNNQNIESLIDLYAIKLGTGIGNDTKLALLMESADSGRSDEVKEYLRKNIETESNKKRPNLLLINQFNALLRTI